MDKYHCQTACVRFELWGGEADYLRFVKDNASDACGSYLGRVGGEQEVVLGEDCFQPETLVELLTLAIGDDFKKYSEI
jgi:hypothetical protein